MGCSKVREESPSVPQDRAPKNSDMLLISLRQLLGGLLPSLRAAGGGVMPPAPPSAGRTAEKGEVNPRLPPRDGAALAGVVAVWWEAAEPGA
mmetsp:Transcript_571/g.1274  ORF Transcript_571/g.1274 Transcript_571/m.1274 type:complete len:92 (-) Transcript_571:410-685(-)